VKLGVISDVHANIHALRAVWAVFEARKVEKVVCLGDMVGYGASPSDVINWLIDHEIQCTLGSSDARVAFELSEGLEPRAGLAEEVLNWTRGIITDEEKGFLRGLRVSERVTTPRGRLRFFHGRPENPDARLDLRAEVKELDELLQTLKCDIVLCGGTHIPYTRRTQKGIFINPGAVGLSLNGEPGADCAVLDILEAGVKVELLKVPYDYAAAIFDLKTWGLPEAIGTAIKTGTPPRG
jgi:putative phosphoesterase